MTIVEKGSGAPIVLIPGIQGRWEYLRPAVDALARSFHVLTFPLCGERRCGFGFDPRLGLDNYLAQVVAILDARRIDRATICGVSFSGVVAVRFAVAHPERAAALVLVSTPGPTWHLRKRHQVYASVPWLFGPLFLAESPFRLRRELVAAFPRRGDRFRFVTEQLRTLVTARLSLSRIAQRARLISSIDLVEDCRRVRTPTLVVTGELDFDHVVPVQGGSQYRRLIPGARSVTIERTGHLGAITRPWEFARLVGEFVAAAERESLGSRTTSTHRGGAPRAGKNDAA